MARTFRRADIVPTLKTCIIAVAVALTLRTGVAQAYVVEGPSMEPTLHNGDRVLVLKYPYGLTLPTADEMIVQWSEPRPGDVVIVRSPTEGIDLVKRVVAVEGQTVEIRAGEVYVDGEPLRTGLGGVCSEEDSGCVWAEERIGDSRWRVRYHETQVVPVEHTAAVVAPGYVFVLGDHRDRSNDSRYFGPVRVSSVRGRVEVFD